jgi:hypothetical protein
MSNQRHYAFNGDADGLCALQQLRLVGPGPANLVTGVKRDIRLLERVEVEPGDDVTVLDLSLDQNRAALLRLLTQGASVRYFDHHYAGEIPRHPSFDPHIDPAPDVCTSILVDRHLEGLHRHWAIVAAFGDGLGSVAKAMAEAEAVDEPDIDVLRRLGVGLNYNAYGESLADLHFHPAALAAEMLPFADPLRFARDSAVYARLCAAYDDDLAKSRQLEPALRVPGATLVMLPDEPWARRASGVYANDLMQAHPDSAIAILSPKVQGGYTVSIRVPAQSRVGADEFCRRFEFGGGRRLAAGVNHLPEGELDRFAACFRAEFASA